MVFFHQSLHQNPLCTCPVPHTSHMPYPSYFSLFCHSNNIWWGVETMKLLIVQYLPLPCYLVPLRPTYLSQLPSVKPPRPSFLLQYKRPHFTPIQNNRQTLVRFILISVLLERKLEDKRFWVESWKTFRDFILLLNSPWMRFCVLELSITMWT